MLVLLISLTMVIVLSALCSLLEAVLLSTPVSHIEKLAARGSASGRILRELRRNVDRPLSAILSLNTIANTGGAFVAGAAFIQLFSEVHEAYFTVFITLIVLFFCEVVPKTVGAVYSTTLAAMIAFPLKGLVFLFAPVIWVCRLLTRVVARPHAYQTVSGEELILMAELGHRAGTIEAEELQVIRNMLSLKEKRARDAMTPRPVVFSFPEALTVEEAWGKTPSPTHSRIPVYSADSEDIVGILLKTKALECLAQGRGGTRLSELMQPVHFVLDTTPLDLILKNFLERKEHLFIVIDEYGGFSGILTLEDVLEEILGEEIVDELDEVVDMRELARMRRRAAMRGQRRNP